MTITQSIQVIRNKVAAEDSLFRDVFGEQAETHLRQELVYLMQILGGRNGKNIAACDPQTVVDSVCTCVVMGLSLNPAKRQAYLIPYGNNCTLRISYQGEIDYLFRNGVILRAVSGTVYSKDQFGMHHDESGLHYRYVKARADRGNFEGVFCVFHLPDGSAHGDYMTAEEVEKRKRVAKSGEFWNNWFDEMARKTAVHFALKGLPMTEATAKLTELEGKHLNFVSVHPAEIDDKRLSEIDTMFGNADNVRDLNDLYLNMDESERIAPKTVAKFTQHKLRVQGKLKEPEQAS